MSSDATEDNQKKKRAPLSEIKVTKQAKDVDMSAPTRCVFYLWYVMEKARLVRVREKRALATLLELGSHDSVTPVNTATKSAEGEKVRKALTNICYDKHSCFNAFIILCV